MISQRTLQSSIKGRRQSRKNGSVSLEQERPGAYPTSPARLNSKCQYIRGQMLETSSMIGIWSRGMAVSRPASHPSPRAACNSISAASPARLSTGLFEALKEKSLTYHHSLLFPLLPPGLCCLPLLAPFFFGRRLSEFSLTAFSVRATTFAAFRRSLSVISIGGRVDHFTVPVRVRFSTKA